MHLQSYLHLMKARAASDLFLSVGAAPALKIEGRIERFGRESLCAPCLEKLADFLLDESQKRSFAETDTANIVMSDIDGDRFRVNLYRQRGDIGIAMRLIPSRLPDFNALNLPACLKDLAMLPQGLVLVVGPAGAGKSTTLAALIDQRNKARSGRILTIEDPVEFCHAHERCIVDQCEVGTDTPSVADAMQRALREAPNVVMIGEMRDRETIEQALALAQTGRLCLATLHANSVREAFDRIVDFFPEGARKSLLVALSLHLKAAVAQRLLAGKNGGRRVPAVELLLQTRHVADLIGRGRISRLPDAMKKGIDAGMMTFEESLLRLYRAGRITLDEALENAESRSALALRLRAAEPAADKNAAKAGVEFASHAAERGAARATLPQGVVATD
jgi:twitching motility protein PilU